ncbi:MAG: ribonuclease HII [Gammaproteobacteria bacterium]
MIASEAVGHYEIVAGVDEAGRGPLAGPVVAAAVILGDDVPAGLGDSKQKSARQRERLFEALTATACAIGIGLANVREIESLNILQATLVAMQRAVEDLSHPPDRIVVDGTYCPCVPCPATALVGGDAKVPSISAASIVAKVTRDRLMLELDARYPEYGFARHKGYPTAEHLSALERCGITAEHRRTFGPVRRMISAAGLP